MDLGHVLEEISKRQRTTDRVAAAFDKAVEVTKNWHDRVVPGALQIAVAKAAGGISVEDSGRFRRLVKQEALKRGAKRPRGPVYYGLRLRDADPVPTHCHFCGAEYVKRYY